MGNHLLTQAIIRQTVAPYPIQLTLFFMFLFKFRYTLNQSRQQRRQRVTIRRIRRIQRRIFRLLFRNVRRKPLLFNNLVIRPTNRNHYNFVRMLC